MISHAMKCLFATCLLSAVLAVAVPATAQSDVTLKPGANPGTATRMMMNCQQHMGGMQKDLGVMMGSVDDMMKNTRDLAMRKQLQAMHDHMSAMMTNMGTMSGMMGGGMMQGGQKATSTAPTTQTSPLPPEDHKAHHSDQQGR